MALELLIIKKLTINKSADNERGHNDPQKVRCEMMDGLFSHERMAAEILNYINEGMKGVEIMFDQQKVNQALLSLAKDYTTTTMGIMKTSMEMYERSLDAMMKQGAVAQEEGQKLLADWTNKAKQGQKDYWDMMDENIKKMTSFFSPNGNKTERKRTPAG